jgi:hypothetical protein
MLFMTDLLYTYIYIDNLKRCILFPGIPVSSTNKTDRQETEILLKVALSTITLALIDSNCYIFMINLLLNMFISRFQCSITIKEPNTVVSEPCG